MGGPNFAQINRGSARNWPLVVTEPSRSSFSGSVPLPESSGQSFSNQSAATQSYSSQPPAVPMQSQPQAAPMQRQPQAVPMQSQPQAVPQRTPPPANAARQAKALFPFQGQDNTEISFQPGQIVTVISQSGDWWVGEINGARGYFPSNYVQLM